jgi:hypothetical protein
MVVLVCPTCDAHFYCIGNFHKNEGRVFRLGEVPHHDCEKCSAIHKELFE